MGNLSRSSQGKKKELGNARARRVQVARAKKGNAKLPGPQVTPLERKRLRAYFEERVFDKEKELISSFGQPLNKPLIIEFDPEDAAEGHYALATSGVTYGVSGTVSVATSVGQIEALDKQQVKYRTFGYPS